MNKILFSCLIASTLLIACNDGETESAQRSISATDELADKVDQRDKYMVPYEVFTNIGGTGGKLVADLSPGDGYFIWKLLKSGASVIAVCDTQSEMDALNAQKDERGIADKDLRVRLRQLGQTGLSDKEVDIVLLSTGLAAQKDPVAFSNKVFAGMKTGGIFCNLEWKPIETPIGPEVEGRYTVDQIMEILSAGGFTDVATLGKVLPYHNLVIGMEYLGGPPPTEDQLSS